MVNWPPVKAWTSIKKIKNNRYFVAINYGITKDFAWVNLVSVIEAEVCIKVPFEELTDKSIWKPGWKNINYKSNESEENINSKNTNAYLKSYESGCLHPSDDSGILIKDKKYQYRPWFPD